MPKPSKQQKKKSAKKAGSNIFDNFTQTQVAEFKEGFSVMDKDKDGLIGKEDLRATFAEMGRPGTDEDFDSMVADAPNPINFTTLLSMFASRSSGEQDDDETVVTAFRSFETEPGKIEAEQFKSMLMSFGDKFSSQEVEDVFDICEMDPDTGIISAASLVGLLVAKKDGSSEETA
ncbi:unnamed protein product [Meganyctiphanes norvegica]|uniref:EF-hand domain-containing protein n=1 Tax=Meganyctiphanes norvegica TaxID=48144 RepID=A0AAV2Q7B8_MEGNR